MVQGLEGGGRDSGAEEVLTNSEVACTYNELRERRNCHPSFWNFPFGRRMVAQALRNVRGFSGWEWGRGGHAVRKLLPRACAKIKLGAQGQQTAWKAGQGSVKSKAPLLQMHSPFHDALKFKRFPDCLTFPAATLAQSGPGAPTQSCLRLPVLPVAPSARHDRGWGDSSRRTTR